MRKSPLLPILCFVLMLPLYLFGASSKTSADARSAANLKPTGKRDLSWGEINILIDPILIWGGAGIAAEYRPMRWFSFYINHQRRERQNGGISLDLGEYVGHTETSQYASVRFYFLDFGRFSPFILAGHKWAEAAVEYSPGFLQGTAQRNDYQTGAYAGAGYRMTGSMGGRTHWIVDLSLNYEPGLVDQVNSTLSDRGFFGPHPTSLSVSYKYGLSPEARFGLSF